MNKKIFLDKASTLCVSNYVWKNVLSYKNRIHGNPSSIHFFGQQTKSIIEMCRRSIASLFNLPTNDFIFNSGATESSNWVINQDYDFYVTLDVTHASFFDVLICRFKNKMILISHKKGEINFIDLKKTLKILEQKRVLFMFEHVNSEFGRVYDIYKISQLIRSYKNVKWEIYLDISQSVSKLKIDFSRLNIDYFAFSGHKIHAFKGIGLIYVKNLLSKKNFFPFIIGGKQEFGKRGGIENVNGILSLKFAMEKKYQDWDKNIKKNMLLEDFFSQEIKKRKKLILNCYCNKIFGLFNINYSKFFKWNNDIACFKFNEHNICISAGSACSSGSIYSWRVSKNWGIEFYRCNLRVSFNENNTMLDLRKFWRVFDKIFLVKL